MKVLITGHNGYIGSIMVPVLQSYGYDVMGLDTNYFVESVFSSHSLNIKSIRKDIRDIEESDLKGIDAIIHLAALSNDPLGNINERLTYDINYHASIKLATLAKNTGVSRFIYASSCSMYGKTNDEDYLTEEATLSPLTPYAMSKVHTEEGLSALADSSFSPVFMRNATAYGVSPFIRIDIVLNNLVGWAYTTGKVNLLSDGRSWRPLVHIRDITHACIAILSAPKEKIHNQAFNIGQNSENYMVREIAEIIADTIPNLSVEYSSQGQPDNRSYRVDFSKLATFFPDLDLKWTVKLGILELYEAFNQNQLTFEELQFNYVRLEHLQNLLQEKLIDSQLRWI